MNLKDFENILWGYCEIDEEIYEAMAPFLGDITDENFFSLQTHENVLSFLLYEKL